jgi:hypothetical protein
MLRHDAGSVTPRSADEPGAGRAARGAPGGVVNGALPIIVVPRAEGKANHFRSHRTNARAPVRRRLGGGGRLPSAGRVFDQFLAQVTGE